MDLINLKYFTDLSCLVKFSVAVAVVVAFINLCADASHVVGDVVIHVVGYVVIIFILVVDAICLLMLIQSLLLPIL